VELSGVNTTPVTVNWSTSNGSAQAGSDYGIRDSPTPPSGTLTFAPGGTATTVRTRTFTVPILQDKVVEVTESVSLALSGPTGAQLVVGRDSATLLILDDEMGGVVEFSAAVFSATECAALPCNATLTVSSRSGARELPEGPAIRRIRRVRRAYAVVVAVFAGFSGQALWYQTEPSFT
jgi:hypothetical protein